MRTWDEYRKATFSPEENYKVDTLAHILGSFIIRRKDLGLSQEELAEKAGVTQKKISQMEGPSPKPSFETIMKVAYALGLKIKAEI